MSNIPLPLQVFMAMAQAKGLRFIGHHVSDGGWTPDDVLQSFDSSELPGHAEFQQLLIDGGWINPSTGEHLLHFRVIVHATSTDFCWFAFTYDCEHNTSVEALRSDFDPSLN